MVKIAPSDGAASNKGKPRAAKLLRDSGPATSSKKRTKGQQRAEQILEIAQDMFHNNGYTGTSMDDIAREVGILKGSLYYYMDSKEDLLYRIALAVHETVDVKLAEAAARTNLSPLQRVLVYVESQILYNTANATQMAVYHHEWRRLEGDRFRAIAHRRRQNEAVVIGLFEEAKELGEVNPDLDTYLALVNVFAVTIWPYTWYHADGPIKPEALAEFCTNLLLNGFASKNQTPR